VQLIPSLTCRRKCLRALAPRLVLTVLIAFVGNSAAWAQDRRCHFDPDNLVVSRNVYDNNPNNIQMGTTLPPNCAATSDGLRRVRRST
jgi:hypothetical protein